MSLGRMKLGSESSIVNLSRRLCIIIANGNATAINYENRVRAQVRFLLIYRITQECSLENYKDQEEKKSRFNGLDKREQNNPKPSEHLRQRVSL